MGSKTMPADEAVGAQLLWQMKSIATKEVESLPPRVISSFLLEDMPSPQTSHDSEEESTSDGRFRAVSVDSTLDMASAPSTPVLTSSPIRFISSKTTIPPSPDCMEHHDWSKRASSSPHAVLIAAPTLLPGPEIVLGRKYGKRKRESFVGLTSKTGSVRATLRKKFSWKQYPEVSKIQMLRWSGAQYAARFSHAAIFCFFVLVGRISSSKSRRVL